MTARAAASGAFVSLGLSCAAWLSLLVRLLGGDWLFVPAFLLLGLTGAVVGLAAVLIERTRLALVALVTGCAAPVTRLVVGERPLTTHEVARARGVRKHDLPANPRIH